MAASGQLATVLMMVATAVPLCSQTVTASADARPSANQLIRDVVFNEAQDRERDSHWEYRTDCVTPGKRVVREQVETDKGPVFRNLALNGVTLDGTDEAKEEQRIDAYIHDPAQVARVAQTHADDENRVASTLRLMPDALIFEYAPSSTDEMAVLAFRPDPAFNPPTYEARLIHGLSGTVTVNVREKRLIDVRGTVTERVDFGYGILGHVDKGGSFELHRRRMNDAHWKTDVVDIHLQGKILMLKTLTKDERETRSDFRPVPGGTTLAGAKDLLDQATSEATNASAQAQFVPAAVHGIAADGRGNP